MLINCPVEAERLDEQIRDLTVRFKAKRIRPAWWRLSLRTIPVRNPIAKQSGERRKEPIRLRLYGVYRGWIAAAALGAALASEHILDTGSAALKITGEIRSAIAAIEADVIAGKAPDRNGDDDLGTEYPGQYSLDRRRRACAP
jgi:hypothetical protein